MLDDNKMAHMKRLLSPTLGSALLCRAELLRPLHGCKHELFMIAGAGFTIQR